MKNTSSNIPSINGNSFQKALFYSQQGDKIRCELCPHECLLVNGKSGMCKTRINIDGTLYTLAYGNLCAQNVDPIEKKPLSHFLPASKTYSIAMPGCNLSCLNCQNWNISQSTPDINQVNQILPEQIADDCISNKCSSIAYTYTEPICSYEFVLETSRIAKNRGIKNILISNGYISGEPLRILASYIDAANIDLKSFSDKTYQEICHGTLQPVLDTLKILKENGVWIEITNLIIPGINDDHDTILNMCNWLVTNGFSEFPLHFSRFVPLYKLNHLRSTPLTTLEKAMEIATEAGIKYIYLGNVQGHPSENTYCPNCKKKLIERTGYHIVKNTITNNCCVQCQEHISGVWRNE